MDEVAAKKPLLNNGTAASVTQSDVLINKFKQIFSNEQDAGSSATSAQDQNSKSSTTSPSLADSSNSVKPSTESSGINLNKFNWSKPNPDQIKPLNETIQKRLDYENGEIIISVGQNQESGQNGISKSEMDESNKTLMSLEKSLCVKITQLRERQANITTNKKSPNEEDPSVQQQQQQQQQQVQQSEDAKYTRDYLIRKNLTDTEDFIEVRVAVVGNVDSGKSTLLGVLTHSILDDGRGEARCKLFRHKHEIETGRTSSVGNDILGFDAVGAVVNDEVIQHHHHSTAASTIIVPTAARNNLEWEEICRRSSKVLTFIDLAGHEKYLKTTVFGMTGLAPDFCMLMIGSNMGIIGMTKEHLGLSLALNVPVFVVLTKIDICPANVLQDTINILLKILKSPGCRKLPYLVENLDDVVTCALNFTSERLCPIFQVSNVTGKNLNLLKAFLNLLNSRMDIHPQGPSEFQIDDLYSVPGVGTVVSGTCFKGRIQLNDTLLLGPDLIGQFRPVIIKGIHRKRLPVRECQSGQTASFALKKIKRSELRKGMVLLSDKSDAVASWSFEAEILVLHHPTTISVNYQAMVHCNSIRQTATILEMSVEHLRTGDKATVRFAFIKNPEYLRPGAKMIFREGRTKAVGTITKVNLPLTSVQSKK